MTTDPYSFEAFQEREKQRRKKLVKGLLITAAVLTVLFAVYVILFSERPMPYNELGLSYRIENTPDGVSVVVFTVRDCPVYKTSKGGITADGWTDYSREIDYRDWTITLYASLWNKLFHTQKGEADLFQCFTTEGVQCVKMEGKWDFTRIIVGVPGENGKNLIFPQLVGRVLYKNPDGSTVLLRDFTEDAP